MSNEYQEADREHLAEARSWWLRVFHKLTAGHYATSEADLDRQVIKALKERGTVIAAATIRSVRTGRKDLTDVQLAALGDALGIRLQFHPVEIMGQDWPRLLDGVLRDMESYR